jgi:transcriptional regulator of acetoin/glycerol metabolism
MVNLAEDNVLKPADIPKNIRGGHTAFGPLEQKLKSRTADTEREMLSSALSVTKGNKKKTALLLGINRSTLYDKLKKYGLRYQYK